MSEFILALDQSTVTTGYAIFQNKQLIKFGHIAPTGQDYVARITKLRNWVNGIIDSVGSDIFIAIEDIQLQEKIGGVPMGDEVGLQTYKKLAHTQGALITLFQEKGIKYEIIPPKTWKSTCGIKGARRAQQKANAQKHILDVYKQQVTEDEADAICIGEHIIKKNDQATGFDWSK